MELEEGFTKLNTISQLENQLREIINNPRKQHALFQNRAAWLKLCSCLDVLGDVELAFNAFLSGKVLAADHGSQYIVIYGILQALFIQQDAITHLSEALQIPYTADPTLTQIRDVRNNSTGHPTKRGSGEGRSFNFISRATVNLHGFQLLTTYGDGSPTRFTEVDIPDLISKQRSILATFLAEVIDKLRREEMEHKDKFSGSKLTDIFPPTLHYHFEKIYEGTSRTDYAELGRVNVEFILQIIESFKEELKKRDILDAYDSITYTLEMLEYSLAELKQYFVDPDQSNLTKKGADIFTYFAGKQMDDLEAMAKEIDNDYTKK